MKKIIIDIDMTLTKGKGPGGYEDALVNKDLVVKLKEYKEQGFMIVLNTSRNMNSYNNNIGLINKNTLPILIKWLEVNSIPYDEIYVGKPWCGHEGFYVDDKAIRPSEFINYSYDEIVEILRKEK
ncbi:capsular biosynthesis protein [Salmonella enterica subsp. diarizonae]|uniref:Capsule biosynthesis phosphatase n=15 Tax=Salmonella enterica TaxID=28901 RepID=A0A3S4IBY7_SALER|nr:capsule biosynthesis phosphatase [Salmonella enterica]EAA7933127.1 capsular biosynthesis protein [Salmonella enterica subsp. enterica serovar Redlands]EBH8036299.1 capsular biosynthesis protein [Salmonella bongori]EBH8353150.1 capsular biosynthesis protein [Salmonella enterica subsp. diarizonae serovar 61:l,[v],[z13]:1,5,[7]]EBW1591734.1 capsular biosynthesis protein [Salmonella enterica subsp. diarizonae serovar 61:r:z]ECG1721312.1 capsular biosynthesis protein [Salmonella enterica subsp. 